MAQEMLSGSAKAGKTLFGKRAWDHGVAVREEDGMGGPGQIDVYLSVPEQLAALLYDFDVDSADLKPEHLFWIRSSCSPYRTRTMKALVVGLTSRAGSDARNLRLSKRRAESVSSQLYLLDPARLVTEEKVAVGEEAAKIAGLRDGVEDGRWRGVFLTLYDPSKLPVPVKSNPPVKNAYRRTYAKVFLSQKSTKSVPMDPQDRRAEAMANLGHDVGQTLGLYENTDDERFQDMDASWTVTSIEINKNRYKDEWIEMVYLEVNYTWGPPGKERVFVDRDKNERRPLSVDEMNQWIENPTKTYRRMW